MVFALAGLLGRGRTGGVSRTDSLLCESGIFAVKEAIKSFGEVEMAVADAFFV